MNIIKTFYFLSIFFWTKYRYFSAVFTDFAPSVRSVETLQSKIIAQK